MERARLITVGVLQGVAFLGLFAGVTAALEAASVHVPSSGVTDPSLDNPYYEFNHWINELIFPESFLKDQTDRFGIAGSHYVVTYIRDLVAGSFLYYFTAGLWHYWIYHVRGDQYFTKQGAKMPGREIILDQIQLAQMSMFMYAALPVLSEWLIENNYTLVYWSVDEIGGWPMYCLCTTLYLALVEIGIYWMHRTLHTNKFLYKYVHGLHHKYNKADTLSPWASVAFNPLDGILQASPYVLCLFVVPCHYLTHVAMLFFTAVWATNIHDTLNGNTEPIMGSKYHTIHHTHYHVNFGQFFIFCDWFWGTLRDRKVASA